ncbi:MAG TPA: hypothetical protein VMD30_13025 [Tepidisphaeraceae bacterium]|nr:hypothetical protein [Tepidisphaeraceae bacterium]
MKITVHMAIIALTAGSQWVLWLAYTDSLGYREMCAGAGGAAIATLAVWIYGIKGKIRFRLSLRDVAQAIYLPWNVLVDTWKIVRAVGMQIFTAGGAPSLVAAVEFEVGQAKPIDAGRQALAITYTTLTPNSIVLGIVPEQGLMIYHRIVPGKLMAATRHLGARP